MNQIQAMRDTVALMNERIEARDTVPDSLAPQHLWDMLETMETGVNPQDTEREFSDAKMGRWLGWAQAAVVAQGIATLDEMKAINSRNIESQTP